MTPAPSDVQSIFGRAVEIESAADRAAYLDQACGRDVGLRAEVEGLLTANGRAGEFMRRPAAVVAAGITAAYEPLTESPGTVIGPYKLLEQIGEGGFGVVFMAEQTRPVRRKVALKILKPGMDTRQVVARFEAERQALALMDHPNIAKVLDGGQTSSGRPYFVMDLVKGLPITDYCDQAQLTPRERLELFVPLCQAVQHAHQKGIIHRDLKPSNVLVTLHDGTPLVKVIDFGIAKALGQSLTDKTLFTGFAQMIGTPLYMSPEQAALSNTDVDTRSDIYSLGVLLYELLTGTTPFDKDRFKEMGYDELRRIIREEEPPRPSTRISTLGKAATTVATQRKSDPRRLSQLCRGELDWIVMKCLEKDRNRRYETASALAADVQRYLRDEPVLACPPSAWYRLRKFIRRKKTALAVASCVFLALTGIAGGFGWAARDRAAREEGIEHDRLAREAALDQTVEHTLDASGPLMEQRNWPEALAVVDRADRLLEVAGRTERPARLLELRKELSMAQRLEEVYRRPVDLETSEAILPDLAGASPRLRPLHSASEVEFFWGREQDGRFTTAFREFGIDVEALNAAEAAALIRRTSIRQAMVKALDEWAAMRKRARGENDALWKKLVEIARQADADDRRNQFREALLRRDRATLEKHAEALPIRELPPATVYALGHALRDLGNVDKAMAVLREAHRRHPEDFWLNDALASFSIDNCRPPRYDDALRYYSMCVALRPGNANMHGLVAMVLSKKGALDDAVEEYARVIELDPNNSMSWANRGLAYRALRQHDKAVADFSKAVELDPKNSMNWVNRAYDHFRLKQYDKALADVNKAIELDPNNAAIWCNRGSVYAGLRRWEESLADSNKAIELDPKYAGAWSNRGNAYFGLKQYDKAIADCNKAIDLDSKYAGAWKDRGNAYFGLKQYDKAIADCNKAIELDPKYAGAWGSRGVAYRELKQYDKAFADLNKSIDLDPKLALAWYHRGLTYCNLKQYNKAVADFNKAIELDPKYAGAWGSRGGVYCDFKLYDKALADCNKAIELDAKDAVVWSNRGNAHFGLKQYDKAIADCNKAIELDPRYAVAWNNRGNAYFGLKRYDGAIADYTKAIELDPKHAVFWSNRGGTYLGLKQYDKAIADYTKAIELDPKDALAWKDRGNAYFGLKQYDKAIADYTKAIELDPKHAVFWSNRGYAHFGLKQYDKAIADYTKAIELDPKHAAAWGSRGVAYRELKQYDKALADLNKSIELDPKDAGAWNGRGNAYFGLKQYDKAIADYTKAIEVDPKGAKAWRSRGGAYYKLKQYDKALADCNKAIELDPKYAGAWKDRGNAYFGLKQYDKAIADYTKAIELDPKHAAAWGSRGVAYRELKQYDKALADLNKSIELDPEDAGAWNGRGNAYFGLKQYDKAIADYTKAIELDPKDALAWNERGSVYYEQHQYEKSRDDFSKAIELDPKNAMSWSGRAINYWRLGQWERSRADATKALDLKPDWPLFHDLAWYLAACPDVKLRDPQRAVELAEKAVKASPKEGAFWTTLGLARYRAGDWQGSAAASQEALKLLQGAGFHWGVGRASFFLAMAQQRLGKTDDAHQAYDRARAWLEANRKAVEDDPAVAAELQRFRKEAEELFALKQKK
jgi:tetratricopeptide (TPR) repeat protein